MITTMAQSDALTLECPLCEEVANLEWDVLDERGIWVFCKRCGVRFSTEQYSKLRGSSEGQA